MSGLLAKFQQKQPDEQGHQPEEGEKERSLMTVLSTFEDRSSFLLLVADCMSSMRQDLADTFDAKDTGAGGASKDDVTQLNPEDNGDDSKDEEELALALDDPGDEHSQARAAIEEAETEEQRAKAEANAKRKAQLEHQRRLKLLSSKEMVDLKAAALTNFDEWRDSVMERIGEAVNANAPDEEEKPAAAGVPAQAEKPLEVENETNVALHDHFKPLETPLSKLTQPERVLILHSVLLLLLSLEHYTAQSRVLLLRISSSLNLPVDFLSQDETKVAQGLLEAAEAQMNADEETKKKVDKNVWSRRIKVGLGATAGAVLIGVTGGLAAPFLAAGVGAVMGGLGLGATVTATYLGAIAGSAPLIGALFGAYGGRMAGEVVDNYAKEVSDFAFIPIQKTSIFKGPQPSQTPPSQRRLRVSIGISGWLNDANDIVKPWQVLGSTSSEVFALRWELDALLSLGSALTTLMKSAAWSVASKAVISQTVFATLAAGLWPLGIVKVARVIDNPFSVARSRSEKAGQVLADALINKVQGERPVTLIGYSLGARVIYSCLEELAKRKAFGLVESVVLAGAPVPADFIAWRRMRSVVSGRLVNVSSTNDYLLGFLYRTSSFQYGIAGLQPISGVLGVENVDVSDTVDGHTKYRFLTGKVLKRIGFEDIDENAVAAEEKALRQQQEKDDADRNKKEQDARANDKDVEEDADEMEAEVEKRKNAGVMTWMSDKMSFMKLNRNPDAKMTEEERSMKTQMDAMNKEVAKASDKNIESAKAAHSPSSDAA